MARNKVYQAKQPRVYNSIAQLPNADALLRIIQQFAAGGFPVNAPQEGASAPSAEPPVDGVDDGVGDGAVVSPSLNDFILQVGDALEGGGYTPDFTKSTGAPWDVQVKDSKILSKSEDGTHCSGFTCSVAMKVMQDNGMLDKLTPKQVKEFQQMWYGAKGYKKGEAETLIPAALEKFGLGRTVTQDEAKPGDFAQIWRKDGSGHSVIFKDWVLDDEGNRIGIKYRSSQTKTKGVGDRVEMFDKHKIDPDRIYLGRIGENPAEGRAPGTEDVGKSGGDIQEFAVGGLAAGAAAGGLPAGFDIQSLLKMLTGGGDQAGGQQPAGGIMGMLSNRVPNAATSAPGGSPVAGALSAGVDYAGSMLAGAGGSLAYGPDGHVDPDMTTLAGAGKGMGAGARIGSKIGSIAGPKGALIGTVAGAAIGAGVGGAAGYVTGKDKEAKFLQTQLDGHIRKVKNAALRPTAYEEGGPSLVEDAITKAQTEFGEVILTPDLQIVPTKSKKEHKDMAPGDITEVLPEGSYVFSNKLKFRPKDIADITVARGPSYFSEGRNDPTYEMQFRDVLGDKSKYMTFSDAVKRIQKKYPVVNDTNDPLSMTADVENKETRMAFLAKLVELQERQNGGVRNPVQERSSVPAYEAGGAAGGNTVCPPGTIFDTASGKCVMVDPENPAHRGGGSQQPPAGQQSVQGSGQAQSGSCPEGHVLDPETGQCVQSPLWDPVTKTWQDPPQQQEEPSPVEDATAATTPQGAQSGSCPEGHVLDPETGQCVQSPLWDPVTKTWQDPTQQQDPANPGAPATPNQHAPGYSEGLIDELTGKYKKIYEDYLKLNDAVHEQGQKDYARLHNELQALNAGSALVQVMGVLGQDHVVEPALAGTEMADSMFARTPQSQIDGAVAGMRSGRDNLVKSLIESGVPPGQAAAMAAGTVSSAMEQEGNVRAKFAMENSQMDRDKFKFLQAVRDQNERSTVEAKRISQDMANKKVADTVSKIQHAVDNKAKLRKAALDTRRELFREKMANYYDTVGKMLGLEMTGVKSKLHEKYQEDEAAARRAEMEARLRILEEDAKARREQNKQQSSDSGNTQVSECPEGHVFDPETNECVPSANWDPNTGWR